MTTHAIQLTKDQENARDMFLDFLVSDDNYFVIQGAAGTGKSFLIRHLLETFEAKYKSYCLLLQRDVEEFDVKITATTNKAVSVIDDFMDGANLRMQPQISTIFSLLGLKVQNDRDTGRTTLQWNNQVGKNLILSSQYGRHLIFIDEASFIGEDLQEVIDSLLRDQHNAKVVYIGDQYQLAPVGQARSVMAELQCKRAVLDEVVRNGNHILTTGTQFRRSVESGLFEPIQYNDTDVIHVKGPEFQRLVEASFKDPNWDTSKSKILAWKNAQVQAYNAHIRQAKGLPDMFQVGEYVITNEFIKGNKSFNASVDSEVRITNIDPHTHEMFDVKGRMIELDRAYVGFMPLDYAEKRKLLKKLAKDKNWRQYFEIKEGWLDLRAVYASSVHKSQGSTYDTVFLDLPDIGQNWNAEDVARLLYVGITRASKRVVCYGYLPARYC